MYISIYFSDFTFYIFYLELINSEDFNLPCLNTLLCQLLLSTYNYILYTYFNYSKVLFNFFHQNFDSFTLIGELIFKFLP